MARHPLIKTRKRLHSQRIDNTKPSARRSADAMTNSQARARA